LRFTETLTVAGVLEVGADTESQLSGLEATAMRVDCVPAPMKRDCAAGTGRPGPVVNVSEPGLTDTAGAAVITSSTGTDCGAADPDLSVMAPEYRPAANPDGSTATDSPPGTVTVEDPRLSQFPALDALALKLWPEAPERDNVRAGGAAPPIA
jgi:hypothetical protein